MAAWLALKTLTVRKPIESRAFYTLQPSQLPRISSANVSLCSPNNGKAAANMQRENTFADMADAACKG
jgi:hypothetical protein